MPSVTIVGAGRPSQPGRWSLIRRALAALTLVACTAGLAACGGDDSSGESTDLPTKTIKVTIEGDSVTPNGDRVEAHLDFARIEPEGDEAPLLLLVVSSTA